MRGRNLRKRSGRCRRSRTDRGSPAQDGLTSDGEDAGGLVGDFQPHPADVPGAPSARSRWRSATTWPPAVRMGGRRGKRARPRGRRACDCVARLTTPDRNCAIGIASYLSAAPPIGALLAEARRNPWPEGDSAPSPGVPREHPQRDSNPCRHLERVMSQGLSGADIRTLNGSSSLVRALEPIELVGANLLDWHNPWHKSARARQRGLNPADVSRELSGQGAPGRRGETLATVVQTPTRLT